jgi:hypothetical protein
MDIRMAITAFGSGLRKNQGNMAGPAACGHVEAGQRKGRGIVIE